MLQTPCYDIRPGNGEGLFWFWCFINVPLTYSLDTQPRDPHGANFPITETKSLWDACIFDGQLAMKRQWRRKKKITNSESSIQKYRSVTQRHKSYLDSSYGVRQMQWSSSLLFLLLQLRQTNELRFWTSLELTPTHDPWNHSMHTLQPT